jgi:phosphate transport system substrate-binding protein
MSRHLRLLGVSAIVAGVAGAAIPASASAIPVITMSGSTSVAPLASLLAKGYLKQYPGRVKFKLAQGGSDVGVSDVAAGRVTIGNSSRDAKSSDPGGLLFNKIAKDAICIVTHPNNHVPNLSQDQVQAIFSGQVRNWSDIPGATATGSINLVVRTQASGTQDAFDKIFMGGKKVFSGASAKASNGLVQQTVQSDPSAIGYVSQDFVTGTNAVSYQGVACNLRTAKSGEYGGVRNFWMVTRGRPRAASPLQKFIYWVQNSGKAAKIIATHWVPLK